jgi:CelD/BcsL family acetyltransferase involved in cellulose biosynthesis
MEMTADVMRPRVVAAQQSAKFSVDVYEGDSLARAGWPSIADASNLRIHVYQSREFLDVWMNTIGVAHRAQSFLIVVSHCERGPVLYLPLVIEKKFNVRLLRFMDAGVVDFNGPVVARGGELTRQQFVAVWSKILSLLPKVDAIDLQKISANVAGTSNPLTYLDCEPHGSSGHSIQLSAMRDDVDARPSVTRLRKKLRRHYRRLDRMGNANFIVNPSAAESDEIFTRLIEFKHRKYMATVGSDFLAMPGVRRFYREMVAPGRVGGISHLSALTCGGNVVSAHLGFAGRGCFYYTFPAYDPAYKHFSVGHLLLQHLIDESSADGFATFDLGEGDFPYKAKWVTHHLPLSNYEHPMTAAGALYLQVRRARRSLGISNAPAPQEGSERMNDHYQGR